MAIQTTPSIGIDRPGTSDTVGTVVARAGLNCEEFGSNGIVRKTVFTLTNVVLTFTDAGSTGYASQQIYDFPAGVILILGTVQDLAWSAIGGSAGNLIASVGTTATADATLSTTEINICPASSASATNGDSQSTAVAFLNGATTAIDAFLNIGSSGDPGTGATVTVNGTIEMTWINLGDNV
jgi:hypothetical protein